VSIQLISDLGKEPIHVYQTHTNPMGRYQFENLPSGHYTLRAERTLHKEGRLTGSTLRVIQGHLPPDTRTSLSVEMGDGKTVSGIVRNSDGEPVQGAYVQLKRAMALNELARYAFNPTGQAIQANEYGQFNIPHVQPGTYTIQASRFGEGNSEIQELEVKEDVDKMELQLK
jgi:protocatechuate 3,4-dioxygenase beta subunit